MNTGLGPCFVPDCPEEATHVLRLVTDYGVDTKARFCDTHTQMARTEPCTDCAQGPCSIALMPNEACPCGCGCVGYPEVTDA